MSEIANMGKTLSIFVASVIYLYLWAWSIDHQKDCNKNAIWEVFVARAFIGIHIFFLMVFFIWSWNR